MFRLKANVCLLIICSIILILFSGCAPRINDDMKTEQLVTYLKDNIWLSNEHDNAEKAISLLEKREIPNRMDLYSDIVVQSKYTKNSGSTWAISDLMDITLKKDRYKSENERNKIINKYSDYYENTNYSVGVPAFSKEGVLGSTIISAFNNEKEILFPDNEEKFAQFIEKTLENGSEYDTIDTECTMIENYISSPVKTYQTSKIIDLAFLKALLKLSGIVHDEHIYDKENVTRILTIIKIYFHNLSVDNGSISEFVNVCLELNKFNEENKLLDEQYKLSTLGSDINQRVTESYNSIINDNNAMDVYVSIYGSEELAKEAILEECKNAGAQIQSSDEANLRNSIDNLNDYKADLEIRFNDKLNRMMKNIANYYDIKLTN